MQLSCRRCTAVKTSFGATDLVRDAMMQRCGERALKGRANIQHTRLHKQLLQGQT